MSEITELNRKPDIDGDVISAVSVGADSATVGSLEAETSITDPAGVAHTGRLADGPVLGAFGQMDVFESDGVFDASNVDLAFVEVVGGGGGGGVNQSNFIEDGDVGGSSSFGSFLSATGGGGGRRSGDSDQPPSGGEGAGGDINIQGSNGNMGFELEFDTPVHGQGGDSVLSGETSILSDLDGGDREGKFPGGGGGGDGSRPGGGGAAGGYSEGFVDLSGTTSVSVTVGSGGAGANSDAGTAGDGANGVVIVRY
jgi:hypothetical protein